jgi:integrase
MSQLQQLFQTQIDADADTTILVVGGKARLYKRSSTQYWQVRFKLGNGKWHSQSTCTPNKEEAKIRAEHIFATAQINVNTLTQFFHYLYKRRGCHFSI